MIPQDKMFFYKRDRTPAVFADLFRLELMRREAGIWADCDVLCVKPLAGLPEYVFGIEAGSRVNNAVFRCPADSELLSRLMEVFEPGAVPPGMPWWRRAEVAVRRALGATLPVQEMQFGATGPWPLNHWVTQLGLERYAQPKPVFYPLDYGAANRAARSGLDAGRACETLAVHLWHSALSRAGEWHDAKTATPAASSRASASGWVWLCAVGNPLPQREGHPAKMCRDPPHTRWFDAAPSTIARSPSERRWRGSPT